MRFSRPTSEWQLLPFTDIKVQGCADATVGFQFLENQPAVAERRYCNKVLVHECIDVPEIDPVALVKAEFMATDDSCYRLFNIFKSSEEVEEVLPTIDIQLNDDDLAVGLLVNFKKTETCCLPLRMSYRLYGYLDSDNRILLSNGNLYVTPCSCSSGVPDAGTVVDCGGNFWTDVDW